VLLREKCDATADGAIVATVLEPLARTGEVVKQEGGAWRIGAKKLAVA
jgi:hypothetical protein